MVENLGAGDHASGVDQQQPQQAELGGGQIGLHVPTPHPVRLGVEHQVVHLQPPGLGGRATDPAQGQLHPRHQFFQRERLDDVVVAAGGQTPHAVGGGRSGGEKQHRRPAARLAQPAQHLEAVEIGQHHVEHDGVRAFTERQVESGRAGGRPQGAQSGQLQRRCDQVVDVLLVVDHQHGRGGCHAASVAQLAAANLETTCRFAEPTTDRGALP